MSVRKVDNNYFNKIDYSKVLSLQKSGDLLPQLLFVPLFWVNLNWCAILKRKNSTHFWSQDQQHKCC